MTGHNKIWRIPKQNTALQNIFSFKLGISKVVAQVLINRGITTIEEARAFLTPEIDLLHDPLLMKDMGKAVDRILSALQKGEKIRVFGDYDVDGITSTTIMMRVFQQMNARADFYIPARLTEGYGLNEPAVRKAADDGISLIVTVDSGISAVDEVRLARDLGIDVIITDHHEPPETIPCANAVLNPKQKDCPYPFKELAGAGVAFKLALALVDATQVSQPHDILDLVCLGTIADIVPLKGENRIIVKHGLKSIARTESLGLRALMHQCGLMGPAVDAHQIAFQMAPRINAAGRLGDAAVCVKLLLGEDEKEAVSLSAELCRLNEERQSVEAKIYKEAVELIEEEEIHLRDKVIVLAREGWHLGVIGIVASKLVKDYYRPVILLCIDGEKAKGSARSIPALNIYEAIKCADTYLEKFGGHSQAAGLTIPTANISEFRKVLNLHASENLTEKDLVPEVMVDTEIDFNLIDDTLFKQLQMLAPYGCENPGPTLACRDTTVLEHRTVGSTGAHLKMRVSREHSLFDCIGFNLGKYQELLENDNCFDIVFTLEKNEWRGRISLQLNVQDIRITEPPEMIPEQDEVSSLSFIDSLFQDAVTYLTDDFYRNIAAKEEFYTKVAGVTFENRQEIVFRLNEGEKLLLLREPDNSFDTSAVKVVTQKGEQVGYLNAKLAKHFAPLLDRGESYVAFVSQVTGGSGKNYGVNIVIQKSLTESREELNLKLSAIRDELSSLPDEILLDRIREALLGGNPYRPKQQEAISNLFCGYNTLAVFGTGRGKSAVFQSMAAFKAIRNDEFTVIIYPLRALVNDQFENMSTRLEKLGLRVYKGNGSISALERASLFEAMEKGQLDILLTTPEFVTHHMKKLHNMCRKPGLFVVDESHHIGMSSQSHRPIYKRLGEIVSELGNPVTLAVTATANNEVADEIIEILGIRKVVIDPHIRTNLQLIDKRDMSDKNRYLKQVVSTGGKTIIYVNSRMQTVELAAMLRQELPNMNDKIVFYHAGLGTEQRNTIEKLFRNGDVTAVVSTSAFGEGIDIPDVKHVLVYHLNFNLTEFNQQCGRCGRDGQTAQVHLLCTRRDAGINQFILEASSPDRATLAQLYVILKEQSAKSNPVTLSNDELANRLKTAGVRFARPNLVSAGIGILEELGLLHREVMGRNRQIFLLPTAEGKINLENSLRFLEGQHEMKVFKDFQEYFFDASSEELLNLINRPIYPEKYVDQSVEGEAVREKM